MTDAQIKFVEIMAIPYFLPSLYVLFKGKFKWLTFVLPLNLFLGFSFLGWLGCWVLIYYLRKSEKMTQRQNTSSSPPPVPPTQPSSPLFCPKCGGNWIARAGPCGVCGAAPV